MDDGSESESDEMKEIAEEYPQYIINVDDYQKIKSIGKGGYAEVWLVSYKGTDKQAALKQLFADITPKQVHHFAREIQTMASANHPFFLKFMGFSPKSPLSLLSEYMPNGSLYRLIRQDPKGIILNGTRKTLIAMGIASAMTSLHKLSIIHRDLKSMNILLDKDYLPRLCDFGIARFSVNNEVLTMRLGTPHWMAPESLYGKGYSFPVDVYSYAMVLYELLTFKLPWAGMDAIAVTRAVVIEKKRPKLPKCPAPLYNLITRCWDNNPEQRPTFSEIYRLFSTGKVYFEGSDYEEIEKLHTKLVDLGFEQPYSNGMKRTTNDNKNNSKVKENSSKSSPIKQKTQDNSKKEKKVKENISQDTYIPNSFLKKKQKMRQDSREKLSNYETENTIDKEQSPLKIPKFSDSSDHIEKRRIPILYTESDTPQQQSQNINKRNQNNKLSSSGPIHQQEKYEQNSPLIYGGSYIQQEKYAHDSDLVFKKLKPRRQTSATGFHIQNEKSDDEYDSTDFDVLSDISNPKFRSTFMKIIKNDDISSNIRYFFTAIAPHFNEKTSSDDFSFMLKQIRPLFEYPYAIDAFQRKGLHLKLPLRRIELFQTVLDFLYVLFSKNPSIFQDGFTEQMEYIISMDPDNALVLLQFCAKKYNQFNNPWSLLDTLFNESDSFLTCSSIPEYISTLYYLCQNYKDFNEARLQPAIDIFLECLHLKDGRVLSVVYNALSHFNPDMKKINYSLISQHIQDEQLAPHIFPLLLLNDVPVSNDLIDALLVCSTTNENAALVLTKLCDKQEFANILAQNPWWATEKLPSTIASFRIFIAVMVYKENRELLAAAPESYQLFKDLCSESDPRLISFISSIVRRFPQKKYVARHLSKSGALKAIIEFTIQSEDESAIHAMLLIIQFLVVLKELDEYSLLPPLLRQQLKINGRSACLSLTLIAILSRFKSCARKFNDQKLIRYFKKLLKDEDYKEYAQMFIDNITSLE